jgi:hypothetical protein
MRCDSAPENKNKCRTDLYAYQIRELELYVQPGVKVLHHRYSVFISNIESSTGALPSQSVDEALSIGVVCTIWSGGLDMLKEILETCPFLPRKSRQRR